MSGLLESIARRRRASASRRLGPPVQNGAAPSVNGEVPAAEVVKPPEPTPAPPAPTPAPDPPTPAPEPPTPTPPPPPAPDPAPPAPTPAPALADAAPDASAEAPDQAASTAASSGFLERGRIRRRARYLRRLREVQLRDIGGFMLELRRFGRQRPDLVEAKLTGVASTDRELRALERALGERVPVRELREAGIGGACTQCGAVYGSGDRFCAWCGTPLRRAEEPEIQPPAAHGPTTET